MTFSGQNLQQPPHNGFHLLIQLSKFSNKSAFILFYSNLYRKFIFGTKKEKKNKEEHLNTVNNTTSFFSKDDKKKVKWETIR